MLKYVSNEGCNMENIESKELKIEKLIGNGSFSSVYKCTLDGKTYAYKEFNEPAYLNGKIRKLDLISRINKDYIVSPIFWVDDNRQKKGYLSDIIDGTDLLFYDKKDLKAKIDILKKCKTALVNMNDDGIIHSDLSKINIMIENAKIKFIDFDNCTFKNYYTKLKDTNDFVGEYIRRYGINRELDTYTFNLLTYSVINNISVFKSRLSILTGNYGLFSENVHAIKICDSLFLDSDKINTDFLIDTIDDAKLSL